VKIIDLELEGVGEYIGNPCEYIDGFVLEMVLEGNSRKFCFVADFGDSLGIQLMHINHCHPWIPAKVTEAKAIAIDFLIAHALPMPFIDVDVNGILRNTRPVNSKSEVDLLGILIKTEIRVGVELYFAANLPY
jgi:hypothetical protein